MDHPVEQMEKWLELQAERVQRNVEIVTPIELEQDFVLHISTNTAIRKFVPVIGTRQASKEDRTVPRICVCPTLLGCFIGYAKAEDDFMNRASNNLKEYDESKGSSGYKGGWKIYSFPLKVALRPNARMVYDAKASDELWLTLYCPEANEYIPEAAGKIFYKAVKYLSRTGNHPEGEVEFFVEVTKEGGLPFSQHHWLDKGYWRIEGPIQQHVRTWADDARFKVEAIERTEYLAAKNEYAALLSLEALPAHQQW